MPTPAEPGYFAIRDDDFEGARVQLYHFQDRDEWSIGWGDTWFTGIYATREAARFALSIPEKAIATLQSVWSVHGENRPATMDDLRALKEHRDDA